MSTLGAENDLGNATAGDVSKALNDSQGTHQVLMSPLGDDGSLGMAGTHATDGEQRDGASAVDQGSTGNPTSGSQIPRGSSQGLVSNLHRNSKPGGFALASTTDTSRATSCPVATGLSDKQPVLAHRGGPAACGPGALFVPRTFSPPADSPAERRERSVGKVPMGELSLSGEAECLSPWAQSTTSKGGRRFLPLP